MRPEPTQTEVVPPRAAPSTRPAPFGARAPRGGAPVADVVEADRAAALWARFWETRDTAARNELLLAYEPLVGRVVSRLPSNVRNYWESDDLHSFGVLGLVEAIDRLERSHSTWGRAQAVEVLSVVLPAHKSQTAEQVRRVLEAASAGGRHVAQVVLTLLEFVERDAPVREVLVEARELLEQRLLVLLGGRRVAVGLGTLRAPGQTVLLLRARLLPLRLVPLELANRGPRSCHGHPFSRDLGPGGRGRGSPAEGGAQLARTPRASSPVRPGGTSSRTLRPVASTPRPGRTVAERWTNGPPPSDRETTPYPFFSSTNSMSPVAGPELLSTSGVFRALSAACGARPRSVRSVRREAALVGDDGRAGPVLRAGGSRWFRQEERSSGPADPGGRAGPAPGRRGHGPGAGGGPGDRRPLPGQRARVRGGGGI